LSDKLEARGYQLYIIGRILKACGSGRNIIVELDAGMGKRVISFLLTKYLNPSDRVLFITPSRASVRDTYNFFEKLAREGNLKGFKFGFLSSGIGSSYREYIIKNNNFIFTTPVTLANILSKNPMLSKFDYIILNEVDKYVKRVSYVPVYDEVTDYLAQYQLVYPWPKLKFLLPKEACWIGLSGTLKDVHTIRSRDDAMFKPELETIVKVLYPKGKEVDIVKMDDILSKTDASKYIWSNLTVVKKIPVNDRIIKQILDGLTEAIGDITKILASRYLKEKENELVSSELIEKAISTIPRDDVNRIRFLRLALIRKFITASVPDHYKRFILRPSIMRIMRRKIENFAENMIPHESSKVSRAVKIAKEWALSGKKVVILSSYIVTAVEIQKKLKEHDIKTFLLTGKTHNKGKIINSFKEEKSGAVLIMTPVGERDIDLPEADLLIVHDVINTPKTMYQRFKRGRRAYVAILYYNETYEEEKVNKLLNRIKNKYPWSIIIE